MGASPASPSTTRCTAPAWLGLLAVAPEFRRRGLGRRILDVYESFVASRGYRRIEFAVDRDNVDAIALYGAQCYRRIPRTGARLTYGKPLPDAAPAAMRKPRAGLLRRVALRLLHRLLVGR
jgi:ribosomal protein S18 acetylase RimI-like enzyme